MEGKVIEMIAEVLGMNAADLSVDMEIKEIEKWDSLMHLMILEAIEERMGKSMPIEESMDIETVGQLIELVEKAS